MPTIEFIKRLEERDKPLREVEGIFKDFAKKQGFVFNHSTYHDWPIINLIKVENSKIKNYCLSKGISVYLKDLNSKEKIYSLEVGVSSTYRFEGLFVFLPFLKRRRDMWKRFGWEKSLGEFKETINPECIKSLLKQAKIMLDNFDENRLQ